MRCRRPARTFRVVRLPAGFANHTTPETQSLFRLLCIRAWAAAGVFFNSTGNAALATKYSALAAARTRDIRNMSGSRGGPWYGDFGLHAGSDAVNAGFLTVDERAAIAAGAIADIVKLPSQSNFNQCVTLHSVMRVWLR